MTAAPVGIRDAVGADDMAIIATLFREYQAWLGVDLCFQGFAGELATLPGRYAPPAGRLLLAEDAGAAAGCVAMRAMEEAGACEMKRLWVRAPWRGAGLGRHLAEAVIAAGRAAGYAVMRLDTLGQQSAAHALYRSLGFVEIAPYYANPLDEVVYLERPLR